MSQNYKINNKITYREIEYLKDILKHGNLKSYDININSYHASKQFMHNTFESGLFPANDKIIKSIARSVFNCSNPIEFEIIEKIINEFEISCSGELHYAVNKQLFNKCYHYMLLGSENLIVLADKLKKTIPNINFRNKLYNSGIGVIIHFLINIKELSDIEKEEISEMLEKILKYRDKSISLKYSFIHRNKIKKENIVKIEKVHNIINLYNIPIY